MVRSSRQHPHDAAWHRPDSRLWPLGLVVAIALLPGCVALRPAPNPTFLPTPPTPGDSVGVPEQYQVFCPDMLDVRITGRPALSGLRRVGLDGRIEVGESTVRVEGQTAAAITRAVAEELQVPAAQVRVRVAEFHSQQIYLYGQVIGLQRTVPYEGTETVIDVLRRAGGLTPGAALGEVYVVRSHVADGHQPEVFHIDIRAIVDKHDNRTNVRLEPYDEVYIGETHESILLRGLSPCLQPVYKLYCRLWPAREATDSKKEQRE